jgi:hypothetical protein
VQTELEPQIASPQLSQCWPRRFRGSTCFWQLALVSILAVFLIFYKLGNWPWDHDEVESLVEMGVLQGDGSLYQMSQLQRLPKLLPVWYGVQRVFLSVLPHTELGTRILSALCGLLTIVLAFVFAQRWRGTQFAVALAMLVGLNQCFIWLVQQNRFYSMAFLFLTLTLATMWWPTRRVYLATGLCAILSVLAVLSHNLLLVVFGITFIASLIGLAFGAVSITVVWRSGVATLMAGLIYGVYLRPLMSGWLSGGTGGTNELVSFVAQLGPATLAVAVLGLGLSLRWKLASVELFWWSVVLGGGVLFIALSPWILSNWNGRYALFFMPPFWVLAAYGIEQVAFYLPSSWYRVIWYLCIALLLVPKLASHYQNGSRHDFRTSAALVGQTAHAHEPIFCNHPMTLEYYLNQNDPAHAPVQYVPRELPEQTCVIVLASNAYEHVLSVQNRRCDVIGEVGLRRFDEQSHVVRIYKIWSASRDNLSQ